MRMTRARTSIPPTVTSMTSPTAGIAAEPRNVTLNVTLVGRLGKRFMEEAVPVKVQRVKPAFARGSVTAADLQAQRVER
jgi:hypothetical protein